MDKEGRRESSSDGREAVFVGVEARYSHARNGWERGLGKPRDVE
jgi:hypothetical protein